MPGGPGSGAKLGTRPQHRPGIHGPARKGHRALTRRILHEGSGVLEPTLYTQKRSLEEELFGSAVGDAFGSGFMRISEQGLNLSARSDVPRKPMLGSHSAFQRFKPTPMKLPPVCDNGPMLVSSAVFNLLLVVFPPRIIISCAALPPHSCPFVGDLVRRSRLSFFQPTI